MYCHQCGSKQLENAQFCSNCGTKLTEKAVEKEEEKIDSYSSREMHHEDLSPNADGVELEGQSALKPTRYKEKMFPKLLFILIPVISLVLAAGGVFGYYQFQKGLNERALDLKKKAEQSALKGDYKAALKRIEDGLAIRPQYETLILLNDKVRSAQKYTATLDEIGDLVKEKEFDQATKKLNTVTKEIQKEKGSLFKPFDQHLKDKETSITVGKIKKETDGLKDVDELGNKLSILDSLSSDQAKAVKKHVVNKIVQETSDQVKKLLTKKDFTGALAILDKGLGYSKDEKKLLSLQDQVQAEKKAFENAEEKRLEKALEAAAKEDLKNHTAAVDLVHFESQIDAYGDLYISGEVENVATRGIYSITIYYTVYDPNGNYYDDGNTIVYPYSLAPGDIGNFEDTIYSVYDEVNVEIDNITWNIE